MAGPEGLEPPTTWFEARCSIQLSYGPTGAGMLLRGAPSWIPGLGLLSSAFAGSRQCRDKPRLTQLSYGPTVRKCYFEVYPVSYGPMAGLLVGHEVYPTS